MFFFAVHVQIRSYSTTRQENARDYVLDCNYKLLQEFSYDPYILSSEVIACFGGLVLYIIVCIKMNGKKQIMNFRKLCDLQAPCSRSLNHRVDSSLPTVFICSKKLVPMLIVVNISTCFILIIDVIEISIYNERLMEALLLYSHGLLNKFLFILTCLSFGLVCCIGLPAYIILDCCPLFIRSASCKSLLYRRCIVFRHLLVIVLSAVSFVYLVNQAFLIGLILASYPFDVGFILLAIGSGFAALLFLIMATVYIVLGWIEIHGRVKFIPAFASLVPYISLLVILIGFLLSYIVLILQRDIHMWDPVTALVAALVPTGIAFIATDRFNAEKKLLTDSTKYKKVSLSKMQTVSVHSLPISELLVDDDPKQMSAKELNRNDLQMSMCCTNPPQTLTVSSPELSEGTVQETEL